MVLSWGPGFIGSTGWKFKNEKKAGDQRREAAVAGDEAVGEDGHQPLSGAGNDAAALVAFARQVLQTLLPH